MSTIYYDYSPPNYFEQVKAKLHLPKKSSLKDTFPILQWLPKYNSQWFIGDIICAITVGVVTIPQSISYAAMAGLPAQYGLYTSIMGVLIYPFIGTSKDISIGTTAINSLLFGQIMLLIQGSAQFQSGEWSTAHVVATLTLLSGIICFAIGFLRLGILFDFICQPAIAGFMGGSGITIVVNQLNKILGISNIITTQPTYLIFGHTLMGVPRITLDAILGITSLIYIYGVRYYSNVAAKKYPRYGRLFFYINITRNIVAIVSATIICFLVNHFGHFEKSPFKIVGDVPAGLQEMRVPTMDSSLISLALPNMVGIVVLQIMEHCAISTSLGKLSDYKINVNKEIISIGVANILGSFFSAYPGTGAFSRTAVMSKSGSRTPLSNIFVGAIVLITIYFFTPALTYIPTATIAAVVCHAVTDLISGPKVWVKYWNTHPSEFIIFACAYVISLVARIDISVYVPIGISIVVQLYRLSRPKFAFLGRLDLSPSSSSLNDPSMDHSIEKLPLHLNDTKQQEQLLKNNNNEKSMMNNEVEQIETIPSIDQSVFISFDDPVLRDRVQPIGHGIICFQPRENLVFENANYVYGALMDEIKRKTRRGKPLPDSIGHRPWNDIQNDSKSKEKPLLHSIILDLSGVHMMDYSAMEQLAELTKMVENYTGNPIPWFIVNGHSDLVRHSLLYAGFGRQQRKKIHGTVFPFHNDIKKKKKNTLPHTHRFGDQKGCQQKKQEEYYSSQQNDQEETNNDNNNNNNNNTNHSNDDTTSAISYQSFDYIPQWCDCNDEEDCQQQEENENQNNIMYGDIHLIRDKYPYFFRSLHDAAKAALEHNDQILRNKFNQSDDTISIQIDN
ncbi:unnamed protein product [Cunninghamella blakesleeana]